MKRKQQLLLLAFGLAIALLLFTITGCGDTVLTVTDGSASAVALTN